MLLTFAHLATRSIFLCHLEVFLEPFQYWWLSNPRRHDFPSNVGLNCYVCNIFIDNVAAAISLFSSFSIQRGQRKEELTRYSKMEREEEQEEEKKERVRSANLFISNKN